MMIFSFIKGVTKKLHPFDIAFIALAIISLIAFFLIFKRQTVYITIRAKTTDSDEFAMGYFIGDKEKDTLGQTVSEIVNVNTYKIGPNETAIYLDIKLKATYNPRTQVYSSKGKDILFGELFTFTFSKAKFKGFIVDLPGLSEKLQVINKKTIVKTQVRFDSRQFSDVYGIPEYIANAFTKGDTVVDTQGNILAKILDTKISAAKRTIISTSGQPIIIDDINLKDVYYTIELSTKEVFGKLYMFDYKPLLIGESIPLYTRHATVWPVIIDIIEQ